MGSLARPQAIVQIDRTDEVADSLIDATGNWLPVETAGDFGWT